MNRRRLRNSVILVVGGAGFIGSHLVDRLISIGAKKIIVIDNLFCGTEDNLKEAIKKGICFYKDDAEIYSSLNYIFDYHKIEIVFNCATKALNYSFLNPVNAYITNVNVVLNLLELQRRGYFETLCHLSTSEVFGTAVYEPMDENHPKNPTTAYAAGKAAADIAIESFVKMFGIDAFILRPYNNYGPRQNYRDYLSGVIPLTIKRIYKGENPIIYGTGKQSRDFIYVYDTIDAIVKLFTKVDKGDNINISANTQLTIEEVITKICEIMNYKGKILRKKERCSDVFCHNSNNNKMMSMIEIDFTPFEIGLNETINWYLETFKEKNYD